MVLQDWTTGEGFHLCEVKNTLFLWLWPYWFVCLKGAHWWLVKHSAFVCGWSHDVYLWQVEMWCLYVAWTMWMCSVRWDVHLSVSWRYWLLAHSKILANLFWRKIHICSLANLSTSHFLVFRHFLWTQWSNISFGGSLLRRHSWAAHIMHFFPEEEYVTWQAKEHLRWRLIWWWQSLIQSTSLSMMSKR